MNNFKDKVIIITGAGGGIGKATALAFAELGAKLAIIDIDGNAANTLVENLNTPSTHKLAVECDLMNDEHAENAIQKVIEHFTQIDSLINNIAICHGSSLWNTNPENWDSDIRGTLRIAYFLSNLVVPVMLKQDGGTIVNIGSVNGIAPAGNPAYSAAKAGLLSLTRSMAMDYAPKGIRTNMVSPGTVITDAPAWQKRLKDDPNIYQKLESWYPVGRVGTPEDIAKAVVFMADPGNGFINGANLVVDGGLTAGLSRLAQELEYE